MQITIGDIGAIAGYAINPLYTLKANHSITQCPDLPPITFRRSIPYTTSRSNRISSLLYFSSILFVVVDEQGK